MTDIRHLVSAYSKLRGPHGHPVGVSGGFRKTLLALQGDEGTRHLLPQHQGELDVIEWADSAITLDIDRPSDLL